MLVTNQEYKTRIENIYCNYLEIIAPFIMQLEVVDGEYPVEIINEIRAVFTHLAKCHSSENQNFFEQNLSRAESHIKRAIIDCYKYLCCSYSDFYDKFDSEYRSIDLSDIDNGQF